MTEIVYSTNNEDFYDYDELQDSLADAEHKTGEKVKVYKGTKIMAQHSHFVHAFNWIEEFQNRAYDEYDEFSDGYLDEITEAKAKELECIVISWLEENADSPRFFLAKDIEEIEVSVE